MTIMPTEIDGLVVRLSTYIAALEADRQSKVQTMENLARQLLDLEGRVAVQVERSDALAEENERLADELLRAGEFAIQQTNRISDLEAELTKAQITVQNLADRARRTEDPWSYSYPRDAIDA